MTNIQMLDLLNTISKELAPETRTEFFMMREAPYNFVAYQDVTCSIIITPEEVVKNASNGKAMICLVKMRLINACYSIINHAQKQIDNLEKGT